MNFDFAAALPLIIPRAVAWAEQQARQIAATGDPLDEAGLSLARRVGVNHPQRIRVSFVDEIPVPTDPVLRQAAIHTGLLGPLTAGLTLGHSIYVCREHRSPRLLSHECRHVQQYELAGSIAAYLPVYLRQLVEFGYDDAPYEIDAASHELDR